MVAVRRFQGNRLAAVLVKELAENALLCSRSCCYILQNISVALCDKNKNIRRAQRSPSQLRSILLLVARAGSVYNGTIRSMQQQRRLSARVRPYHPRRPSRVGGSSRSKDFMVPRFERSAILSCASADTEMV